MLCWGQSPTDEGTARLSTKTPLFAQLRTRQIQNTRLWDHEGDTCTQTHTHTYTHTQLFTCSLMEQAEFGEDRSSISDPLDPEDVTLIWSAGSFLDPSLTVSRLKTENKTWANHIILKNLFSCYCVLTLYTTNYFFFFYVLRDQPLLYVLLNTLYPLRIECLRAAVFCVWLCVISKMSMCFACLNIQMRPQQTQILTTRVSLWACGGSRALANTSPPAAPAASTVRSWNKEKKKQLKWALKSSVIHFRVLRKTFLS